VNNKDWPTTSTQAQKRRKECPVRKSSYPEKGEGERGYLDRLGRRIGGQHLNHRGRGGKVD